MRISEIRQKNVEELVTELSNLRKELFDLRFQTATENIENPSRIGQIRKTIARIETVKRERALESERVDR